MATSPTVVPANLPRATLSCDVDHVHCARATSNAALSITAATANGSNQRTQPTLHDKRIAEHGRNETIVAAEKGEQDMIDVRQRERGWNAKDELRCA